MRGAARFAWVVCIGMGVGLGACSSAEKPIVHGESMAASSTAATVASDSPSEAAHPTARPLEAFDRIVDARVLFASADGIGEPVCEKWSIATQSIVDDDHGTLSLGADRPGAVSLEARIDRRELAVSEACAALGKGKACAPCDASAPQVALFESEDACRARKNALTPTGCTAVFTKGYRQHVQASLDGSLRARLLERITKEPTWKGSACLDFVPRRVGKRILLDSQLMYPFEIEVGDSGTLIIEEVPEANPRHRSRGDEVAMGCCDVDRYRVLDLDARHAELISIPHHAGDAPKAETWWFGRCAPQPPSREK